MRQFFALGKIIDGRLLMPRLQPEVDCFEGQVVEVRLALADERQIAAYAEGDEAL